MLNQARLASGAAAAAAAGLFFASSSSPPPARAASVKSTLDQISERLTRIELALGTIVDPRQYVIYGSPEASKLDLDFDLTMHPLLVRHHPPQTPFPLFSPDGCM